MIVCETKLSISGEISRYPQGSPAFFIRLGGCNLSDKPCIFCDTTYALKGPGFTTFSVENLTETIRNHISKDRVILITGGEPLTQSYEVISLIKKLLAEGFKKIVVETNGTFSARENDMLGDLDVCMVADYKPPSSGNNDLMYTNRFIKLTENDVIKFPILNIEDLDVAINIKNYIGRKGNRSLKAASPIFNKNQITKEVNEIVTKASNNGFILSVQLHKLLNVY